MIQTLLILGAQIGILITNQLPALLLSILELRMLEMKNQIFSPLCKRILISSQIELSPTTVLFTRLLRPLKIVFLSIGSFGTIVNLNKVFISRIVFLVSLRTFARQCCASEISR
jgi:hypothetical protein